MTNPRVGARLDVTEACQSRVRRDRSDGQSRVKCDRGVHFLWIDIKQCRLHVPFEMCRAPFMTVISSASLIMISLQIEPS